ncbi:MAG TPA: IS1182 family transposase [Candidatus Methylacidiphilales bacterium]|jgi:transposase|nr:IS1182 family transposase [Candidatus Methylacidiphilales bacterium]
MTHVENKDVRPARLRVPDRLQSEMVVLCPDDLISKEHQARVVWQVCQSQDLSDFCEPIKARQGVCGRDATSPVLLVALWLYATVRGVGSARELARLCKESKPFQWLCGGVSLNHHTLSDFRVDHGAALDALFTRIIATLVEKKLVKVSRISQDGTRVRACAGAASYRRHERLQKLMEDARQHVQELKKLLEDPEKSAGLSAKQKAARTRAARERQQRVEAAINRLPELKKKQEKLAKRKSEKEKKKLKEPRASTTDAEATVMKMSNGGFNPALNVQLATDPESRAIVGVEVSGEGNDHHLAKAMRQQVEQRSGQKVSEHLVDGGYLVKEEIEEAAGEGVTMYVPPKPPRKQKPGSQYEAQRGESQVLSEWRQRMGSAAGQEIYKQRAATSETANGDLRTHRGMDRMLVRGVKKGRCVALWCALAYNVMHFAAALIA